jgi:signal peptidase I
MEETLQVGDLVLAERASWSLGRTPRNGEIIVFDYPRDPTKLFVKRVVGVPGDRIRMQGTKLYRNGSEVIEDYAVYKNISRDQFPPSSAPAYITEGIDDAWLQQHVRDGEILVPEGNYFVLGDNRDNSLDSRYWGFVPRENISASVILIYASYDTDLDSESLRALPTILNTRWERLLKVLI